MTMAHKHKFRPVMIATQQCNCGVEGQQCEGCRGWFDLADMRSGGEGCWLCKPCVAELVAHEQAMESGAPASQGEET